ncbi:hypothetical protein RB653_005178 [Dictyostelium firmibasis]|uniref:FNIP repeat-containing protein n=1 Tax=Dictyostelium firmibasis TaxID=79012 RepID=A0AAN7YZ09_9MYCE
MLEMNKLKLLNYHNLQHCFPRCGIKSNKVLELITYLDFKNISITIPLGKLPNTIKKIKFDRMHDCELLPESLPDGLLDLTLCKSKFQLFEIPKSVTNLSFSDQFNNDIIPDLGGYNCYLEPGALPKSIKTLKFGREYNKEFSKGPIPDSVINLTLSHIKFNSGGGGGGGTTSDSIIPSSVINLSFQDNSNKPIEMGILQSVSLETLKFGRNFNSTIAPLSIPSSLKKT